MSNRKLSVANFNIVFLDNKDKEAPMLRYFNSIVWPALTSDIKRTVGDSTYFLLNVELDTDNDGDYIITGNIVRRTILEKKSDMNEAGDQLVLMDETYPTAPFSLFVIYLKNHRMIFVENQKGSPTLQMFSSTVKQILARYVKMQNIIREKEGKVELPVPMVKVIGIPMEHKLKEVLHGVEKINKLVLKFYPLNGDIDFSGVFGETLKEIRMNIGSKTGSISFNSPENIDQVVEMVSSSEGTVEPVFEVTYPDKTKGKIRNNHIAEKRKIEIKEDDMRDELNYIIEYGKSLESVTNVSPGNLKIYNKYKHKLENKIDN